MTSNSDEYTAQQIIKYNGHILSKALIAIGNEASADELTNFISQDIGQRKDIILPEVKQVLRRGVDNGFLVRNGPYYSISGKNIDAYVDCAAERRRTHSSNRSNRIKETPKRFSLVRKSHVEEEQEEEANSQGDDSEMETDSVPKFRAKVRLYGINDSPGTGSQDSKDEQP